MLSKLWLSPLTVSALLITPAFAADTSGAPNKPAPAMPATRDVNIAEAYQKAADANDASFVTELAFTKGSAELSADGKSQLRDIMNAAKARGKIDEVQVLAWADADYPNKGRLGKDATKLADERSQEIGGYIEDTYKGVDVDNHNMAEKPATFEKLFRVQDARVKRTLEKAGLAYPAKSGMPSKASRALVMVIVR